MVGEGEQAVVAVAPQATAADFAYSSSNNAEFRQGEIISGLIQYIYSPANGDLIEQAHPFVVIASQDCDLLQDFNKTKDGGDSDLNSILCYEARIASEIRTSVAGSDIWKRVIQNNDERYHALQAPPPVADAREEGLPDLVIDFKRFFSISSEDLRFQIGSGQAFRRSCLEPPYREHFQNRAAAYLQRVGVPEPHKLAPVVKKQAE